MSRLFTSNYLVRLLIFSLLIGTVPVVTLGTLSFIRAKDSVQQKVNDSNMQLLQQTQKNVEQVLQLFENLMTQYVSTSLVREALQTSITERNFEMLNELTAGLNKMQPYELGAKNVYMANLKNGWIISNQGYSKLEDSDMLESVENYIQAEAASYWTSVVSQKQSDSQTALSLTHDPALGVRLIKKLPLGSLSSTGLIIGELPAYSLEKLVFNESPDRETIILDRENRLLTQPEGRVIQSTEELNHAIESINNSDDKNSGYLTFKTHNETIGVMYRQSAYNGWKYLSFSSVSDITKDSRAIGWYTLYVSLGVFLVIFFLSWAGSKRMYSPIQRILSFAVGDQSSDDRHIKDELQFIGDHIHSLRNSQTELRDQLRKHSKQLEAFFIRRLLQGEIRPGETRERWQQFSYDSEPAQFGVMTVQIDNIENTRYTESDLDLLMFAINNIVGELIPATQRLEPVVMVNNQVTICRSGIEEGNDYGNDLYRFAERIQATIRELLNLKISIGISRLYTDINDTPHGYKQSLEALTYRVRFGEQVILPFDSVLPDTRIAAAYPDWLEKELIDAVKTEERDKARDILKEFIQKVLGDYPRYYDFQMAMTRLLIDLIREWQEAGESVNPLQASGKPINEHLLELKTAEEIEEWIFHDVIEPMMAALHQRWESQNKKISERMLDMIHMEFESELTLELCASRLNYHPNYIKTVFRKETGSNFSDYLSKYRLSVAKQWLVETDMKINEIAERLQYHNSQNFIRYFRKLEDMTPGQYREKHR
ncbi:AraC family transcriptional regulator [Paenibacillus radicis (ex Xue et al. 2023)]|uniref:AraC family transcriptional regulator n=1 Tax=Paenibacillus radicis (ex Xue et al. 2023) TaxID=2972489 RepID=A0ABT1YML1_9BACL|nr:AraC family transcriptional regulator [Paenibacillus radicis (ex Xue et al. 2023)]MCR8634404.1 AraC family transcriptional regulator [Paenibacillus radicis (ex Xue et al. 2023)]